MAQVTDPAVLAELNSGRVTDPKVLAELNSQQQQQQPHTWHDRMQALDSGLREGGAYLGSTLTGADPLMNIKALAQAAAGTGYLLAHHGDPTNLPSWLDPAKDPTLRANAAGAGLTHLMDKNQYTTTQVANPDAANSLLHVGGSLVPGSLAAGAGGTGSALARALVAGRALTTGGVGTAAAAGVHALHPFQSDAAENAAEAVTGLVGSGFTNKLRGGAPVADNLTNAGVQAADRQGLRQPAFATNPNPVTSLIGRVAKQGTVVEKAEEHNQPIANQIGRSALGLTPSTNPIDIKPGSEYAQKKAAANAAYQAGGTAGPIMKDPQYQQGMAAAHDMVSGTSQVEPELADGSASRKLGALARPVTVPYSNTFDARAGINSVGQLRTLAYQAGQKGNAVTAGAYHSAADTIEGAMDRSMAGNPQNQDLINAWRGARQWRATAHTVEDSLDQSGNVRATDIGDSVNAGRVTDPGLQDLGLASNAAKGQGFGVPGSKMPKGGFLGEFAASIGMGGGTEALQLLANAGSGGEHGGPGLPMAVGGGAFVATKGAQALARQLALRAGQYQRTPPPGLSLTNGWVGPGTVPLAQGLDTLQQPQQ